MILAMDVGGTCIKAAVLGPARHVRHLPTTPSQSGRGRDEIVAALRGVVAAAGPVDAIGIAIPGPFDYARGISLMTHKFAAIHGQSIPERLKAAPPVRFVHDVNAFLLGECHFGSARGCRRAAGITLGTGLGAAMAVDGQPLCNALGSPADDVSLWRRPFRDGIVEDAISARALLARCPDARDVKEIEDRARGGDVRCRQIWLDFGRDLADVIRPWHDELKPEIIIIGGQIAKALPLFQALFAGLPVQASSLEDATLLGATTLFRGADDGSIFSLP